MKANKNTGHFLKNDKKHASLKIDNEQICKREYENILGIKVGCNSNFQEHLNSFVKKAAWKCQSIIKDHSL